MNVLIIVAFVLTVGVCCFNVCLAYKQDNLKELIVQMFSIQFLIMFFMCVILAI